MLGINTTIIDNITTESGIDTGGGTVVIKDFKKQRVVRREPCRFIK